MRTPKEVILYALNNQMGDNLERAEIAFRGFTPDQLNKEYGQSGRTCQQILDGYRLDREEVKKAIIFANTL